MSDVNELLSAFETRTLLRPDHTKPNLVDLASAIATTCGVENLQIGEFARSLTETFSTAQHLIFILADGLGSAMLRAHSAPFLRTHLKTELQVTFPSSTATALTSLATAQWPARHAITGWWTHLPQISDATTILQFRRRSDNCPLEELGVTRENALPLPSLLPQFRRNTLCLFPEALVESDYSRYWSGDTARYGYHSMDEAAAHAINAATTADIEGTQSYTYIYFPHIDRSAHEHGPASRECREMISAIDMTAALIAERLRGRAIVVLSSDHGHLVANPQDRLVMYEPNVDSSLLSYAPAGDLRVLNFHVRDGATKDFATYFRGRYSNSFFLLTSNEVDELRLFGPEPLSPNARARIGDFVAISRGSPIIAYESLQVAREMTRNPSHHGGLSSEELLAPLIITTP